MAVLAVMLLGTVVAGCGTGSSKAPAPPSPTRSVLTAPMVTAASPPAYGYWLVAADGGISAFGDARLHGSAHGQPLNRPLMCMTSSPSAGGYWLVTADGGIFAFGDAGFYGSTGSLALKRPIVGMAATPTGQGYWLVAADGGIFAFGDARFSGSTGTVRLTEPIVGMAATPTGRGYWLVAADGGIFAFGDAAFYGSTAGIRLTKAIIGMAPSPAGRGYRLAASDGAVFAFGDVSSVRPAGTVAVRRPIAAIAATPTDKGYWLASTDGTVYSYGDAPAEGSPSGAGLSAPIIGMAGLGMAGACHAAAMPANIVPPPGATPGEGQWVAAAQPVGGKPAIFTTVLRPRSGGPSAGLAWIDANQVVTRLYAGPGQPAGSFAYRGVVDPSLRSGLLAAFNSGFKVGESRGGWYAYGQTAIPLRHGAASLIIRSDGSATVGMWGRDATSGPGVVAVRQNLGLLVDHGTAAADLSPGAWGAVLGGGAATWRSGLGVDPSGHLVYATGPGLRPGDLAQLLLAAGCVRAMQLDINPQWVTFTTFVSPPGSPPSAVVGTTLLATMNYGPTHYLNPSGRDFLAVFSA